MSSPFVIGVSGHRDPHPAEVAHLIRQVEVFLAELKRRLPDTELRIMTGMAQGADLLAAHAAAQAGCKVDAVLPMPLERYIEDFDAESAARLRALLADPAVTCTVLPPPPGADQNATDGDARAVFYANLTQTLTDKCNLLLALWDGRTSQLKGGTADTVLRYLAARTHGGPDNSDIEFQAAAVEAAWGPHFVYWIPTPRLAGDAVASRQPGYLTGIGENLLATHGTEMPHALAQQLAELNTYNREFERVRGKGAAAKLDSLLPTLGSIDASDREDLQRIDLEYGKADALAIYYQRHSDRLFRGFSYTASCMALLFLIYAKLWANNFLLSVYVTILLVSVIVFHRLRSHQWFSKHLVYRALAETMRIKFFLRAAHADRLVNATELINLTAIDQFSGFSWIANLLKNVESVGARESDDAADRARLQSVHRHWIVGQQDYFRRRIRALERDHRRLEKLKSVMMYMIATFALVLLLFAHQLHERMPATTITGHDGVMFLMGLLPVWLGIWELYQNKMAMRELLWQYRNQLGHFTIAELQLARETTAGRSREILAQVGKEALMESYLWTIHRYHREYEPPAAT
jgi:hypothetical protein